MTYNPQRDIADLMKLYDQEVSSTPSVPDRKTLLLRARLIAEEAEEFVKAAGCKINYATGEIQTDWSTKPNLVGMADAVGDILVVTYGAANAIGVKVEPLWDEIHDSNKAKVHPDGTIHKREDGKTLKPSSWKPPNILKVLTDQGFEEDKCANIQAD